MEAKKMMIIAVKEIKTAVEQLTVDLTFLDVGIPVITAMDKSIAVLEENVPRLKQAYNCHCEQHPQPDRIPDDDEGREMIDNIYKATGH